MNNIRGINDSDGLHRACFKINIGDRDIRQSDDSYNMLWIFLICESTIQLLRMRDDEANSSATSIQE